MAVDPGDRDGALLKREATVAVEEGLYDRLVLDGVDAAGRVDEPPAGGEEAGDASDPPPERRGAGCNKLQ